jgi:hypothetical protein
MGRPKGVVSKIADETGLDQATVRRAMAAANLTEQQCEADIDAAVDTVAALADTDRVIGHEASGRGEGGNRASTAYAEAKAQSELHRARKLEIQNAKLEGELISRKDMTETGVHIIATVRTGLLSLGYRIAEKVAGKTDLQEIARITDAEVRDVLGLLADETQFFAALEADALS